MKKLSLEELLRNLNKEQLNDLIRNLVEKNSQVKLLILEWLNERLNEETNESNRIDAPNSEEFINDELLMEYWGNAKDIIASFNQYGGGPEDEEEEAYDWLNEILELIRQGKISTQAKRKFMDEAFVEYDEDNSGFEDSLMDIFFELCETREDWEYLVKKLGKRPSDWRSKLIMNIYRRHLEDDDIYLKERLNNLRYGMDYWDLVDYYLSKGMLPKAVETAESGILKGEGRLTELFDFLFDHFVQTNDVLSLERIVDVAIKRNSDEKHLLDRLFEYYRKDNYEKAKAALLASYKHSKWKKYFEEYKRMKEFLHEADWSVIEPKIIKDAEENNISEYLRICLEKGMNETVLTIITNPPQNRLLTNNFDEFAARLEKEYPEKIIEYYFIRARANIEGGNRMTYRMAVTYLAKIKYIYTQLIRNVSLWEQQFLKIKNTYKNRPAFIDEVNKSKL